MSLIEVLEKGEVLFITLMTLKKKTEGDFIIMEALIAF